MATSTRRWVLERTMGRPQNAIPHELVGSAGVAVGYRTTRAKRGSRRLQKPKDGSASDERAHVVGSTSHGEASGIPASHPRRRQARVDSDGDALGCADCCAVDELLGGLSLRAVADAQRLASAADGAAQEVVLRVDQLVGHP